MNDASISTASTETAARATGSRRRRLIGGLLATATAGVVLGLAAGPASAAPTSCSNKAGGDCITGLGTSRTPDSITIKTFSPIPTRAYASATATSGSSSFKSAYDGAYSQTHTLKLTDLRLAQNYGVTVQAYDKKGGVHTERLQVATHGIKTVTTVDTFEIINDSDVGNGELYGHVQIDGRQFNRVFADRSTGDWTDIPIGVSATSFNRPSMMIRAQVADDDCDVFGCADVLSKPPFSAPAVSSIDGAWLGGSSFDDDTAGLNFTYLGVNYFDQGRHDFEQIDDDMFGKLRFRIHGHTNTSWTG